jgi:carbamoyl-phosphate synthase small subunit
MSAGTSRLALPVLTATRDVDAALLLSDGSYFLGKGIGRRGKSSGEACFNTSMTGYQEILTDPSYAGQIVNFTCAHVGNVGCNASDMESAKAFCAGLVLRNPISDDSGVRSEGRFDAWLAAQGVVGISGVDTRALTRKIRTDGACGAVVVHASVGEAIDLSALADEAAALPSLDGADLASAVTTEASYRASEGGFRFGHRKDAPVSPRYRVVAIDYGVKRNILRCLVDAGFDVTVVPATASFEEIMSRDPDGVFLSNGPADPLASAAYAVPVIRKLLDADMPLFGICFGSQLLALASGLKTAKMHAGHRGANHPVKNLRTGAIEITSQNHGFCVSAEDVPDNVEITHLSLFDGTVEGVRRTDKPAFSVQYHPESSPGPHDSRYLFEEFAETIRRAKSERPKRERHA